MPDNIPAVNYVRYHIIETTGSACPVCCDNFKRNDGTECGVCYNGVVWTRINKHDAVKNLDGTFSIRE